ncbi:MAG TPA: universal stress protein [Gammaproteobacteria bacterium]|jgi:nucleotide-binding universal stress UspA family protein|nr:universal stress protein [Gammaproteobacteria bacterium]
MAYRNILLAYDGSSEGRRALLEGTEIAKRFDAMTHLLAVIKPDVGTGMAQGLAAAEPGEKTQYYQGTLNEGVKFLKSHGLEAEGHVVHGEPVDEIVKFAKRVSADLVVVGHRTRGTLARWWTTPTSMSLLDKLECSLLIGMQEADLSVLPTAELIRRQRLR